MTTMHRSEPDLAATTDFSTHIWAEIAPILRDVPEPLDSALHALLQDVVPLMASAAARDGRSSDETTARIRTSISDIAKTTDDVTFIVEVVNELTSRVLQIVMSKDPTEPAFSPRAVSTLGSTLVAELLTGARHTTARKHPSTLAKGKSQRAHELLHHVHADECDDYDLAPAYAVVAVHFNTPAAPAAVISTFEQVAGSGALATIGTSGGFALLPAGDEADSRELAGRAHTELPGRVWMSVSWRPRGEITCGRQEASNVLSLALAADYDPGVYRLDDLLVEYAVTREPTVNGSLIQIIELLLQRPALYETLKILIMTDGNGSQAAERLLIHRTTLDYRIQRIEQLTGLHPGSVRGINVLSAAVTAHALSTRADQLRQVC